MDQRSRRRFLLEGLTVAGLGLLTGCGVLPAGERTSAARRAVYLSTSGPQEGSAAAFTAFKERLGELGYVEGRTLLLEEHHAESPQELVDAAAEVTRLAPEVIVVPSTTVALALRAAGSTLPVVSAGAGDLVAAGLAASLAQPGGNVTGLSTPFLGGKQLELLLGAAPGLTRVAVLYDSNNAATTLAPYVSAARSLSLMIDTVGVGDAGHLEATFGLLVRQGADGVLAANGSLITANQTRISELASRHGLPSIFQQSEAGPRGALLAYSPNRADLYRRAAAYVDRILRGASPADLPVEQPSSFDLVINLKTSQALGLTIPPSLLQQATEIIQ